MYSYLYGFRKNFLLYHRGVLAQLGARNIRIVEARGSNPLYSTFPAESEHEKMFGFCTFHPIAKLLFPLHYDF